MMAVLADHGLAAEGQNGYMTKKVKISMWPEMMAKHDTVQAMLRALPGLAICAMGFGISLAAQGQPAWFDNDVGPGLMARLLGTGVMGLGAIWVAWCVLRPAARQTAGCGDTSPGAANWARGPALLGAVLVFALCLPALGLVISAGMAAALAAIGAGERNPVALTITVVGLTALTAGIGLVFLPPTAPLWPAI